MLENVGNAITRLPMDWLGRNLGRWVVASNQRFYRETFSSVLVKTANRTVNVLVLWGISKTSTILMKFGWLCATVLQKIKSSKKQPILIQKNLRIFITVKAIVQWHI